MIIAAAIKMKTGSVFVGKRHTDAYKHAFLLLGKDIKNSEDRHAFLEHTEGFITSDLVFLDRQEAYIYAEKIGQLKRQITEKTYNGNELYSEDVW